MKKPHQRFCSFFAVVNFFCKVFITSIKICYFCYKKVSKIRPFNKYTSIASIMLLIVVTILLTRFKSKNIEHIAINSAFYYKTSKLYASNTMVLLLNARRKLKTGKNLLKCHSKNLTTILTSTAQIRIGDPSKHDCSWDFFIVNCTTVLNPQIFSLTTKDTLKKVKINFEYPESKQYPVVMCYPPMVYESRWQQIIFATEIYHYFGTNLQVQYINSAMKEIIDLLKIYERKQWITIRNFAYFDFNLTTVFSIGYNPMLELNSRNQGIAYTDCLMKYRESAEYVIVADVDDVFIPPKGTYYNEFSYWNKINPNVAAFFYYRKSAIMNAAQTLGDFSLFNSIKTFRISNTTFYGKSVYQTKNSEVAWIHTPGLKNEIAVVIPPEKGNHIYHVQINDEALRGENPLTYSSYSILSDYNIRNISEKFISSFKDFPSFHGNSVYAESILKCYTEHEIWVNNHKKKTELPDFFKCINPLKCAKQTVENFDCKVIRRDFSSIELNENMILHVPKSNYYWWSSKNGCSIFLY